MKNFLKNNWHIFVLQILVLTSFIVFFGKFGDLIVDTYREVYIPQEILDGKLLYKNIFTIYAPFSYLFNALIFKILGSGVNILLFAGLFTTFGIFYLSFKIAEYFTNKTYAFWLCIFFLSGLVLSPNVFNAFLPYSFGIMYGLLFVLLSIYFAIKSKFPISYLFYSLAICSKYEFIAVLPALIYLSKKQNWQKNIITFIIPPLTLFTTLKIMGISFNDIKTSLELILIMSQTKTLAWFYSVTGLTFRLEHFLLYGINLLKFLIPCLVIYYCLKLPKFNQKILLSLFLIISILLSLNSYQEIIIYAFPLCLILLFFRFKELNITERFFIIASLLISLKVFFALTLQSYGVYFIPFALISLLILTPQKYRKSLVITIAIFGILVGLKNIELLCNKDVSRLDNIVEYVKSNTKPQDKVIVYPECLAINVLADRKSDNKFYSLIPMYVETFGENLIIKRLELTKPEYIIIHNYDTSAYFYKEFGVDYAIKIKNWINQNYKLESTINEKLNFNVYKKF